MLEITTLHRKSRIRLNAGLESFLSEVEARFTILAIFARAGVRAVSLAANYPQDPAGRIIAATALVEGLTLLTADKGIRQWKLVPTLW